MLNGDILREMYEEEISYRGFSVFTGVKETTGVLHFSELPNTPIMQAFFNDDEIQEITVTSTNFGISRTYSKQFKRR